MVVEADSYMFLECRFAKEVWRKARMDSKQWMIEACSWEALFCFLWQQNEDKFGMFLMLIWGFWSARCEFTFLSSIQTPEQLVGDMLALWDQSLLVQRKEMISSCSRERWQGVKLSEEKPFVVCKLNVDALLILERGWR